jgi:hypothetical protein
MEFIGKPITGSMLVNMHYQCIESCSEVKAAIAYAQQGTNKIHLFEDCLTNEKKLTFYGRLDGSCPIDIRILAWFLSLKSPNATCRLVPHWLHAKVIWWVGAGAYVGSANLTERAWNNNYEAGLFLTHEELEHMGVILHLDAFFDGLEEKSIPLNKEEYDRQVDLGKRREALMLQLEKLQTDFESTHWKLKDRTSPISVDTKNTQSRKLEAFKKEWGETLQLIRDIGSRVSDNANRPAWIAADVPQGVQADQFLHAYYYQQVRPQSGKDAYEAHHKSNKANPEAALKAALAWWKAGDYKHDHEAHTIYTSSKMLREYLSRENVLSLNEGQWVEALTNVYAFGDHATKVQNSFLGLGADPGAAAKGIALAKQLWKQSSTSGKYTALQVVDYLIWGPGEVAERIWNASTHSDWKLPHIGFSVLGEMVGWARPTEFPPRNARTSKALRSLGYSTSVFL